METHPHYNYPGLSFARCTSHESNLEPLIAKQRGVTTGTSPTS